MKEGSISKISQPTRTLKDRELHRNLLARFHNIYGNAYIVGIATSAPDLNGDGKIVIKEEWLKMCPCFDAKVYNFPVARSYYHSRWLEDSTRRWGRRYACY